MKVAVLNGPNLQLLGTRETEVYGTVTLAEIEERVGNLAEELSVGVEFYQTNHEGEMLDFVGSLTGRVDGIVVNPAAWTHTSVAFRDALLACGIPFAEVHLSNIAAREGFRQHSYLSDAAAGVVYGFGVESYLSGFRGLVAHLTSNSNTRPSGGV